MADRQEAWTARVERRNDRWEVTGFRRKETDPWRTSDQTPAKVVLFYVAGDDDSDTRLSLPPHDGDAPVDAKALRTLLLEEGTADSRVGMRRRSDTELWITYYFRFTGDAEDAAPLASTDRENTIRTVGDLCRYFGITEDRISRLDVAPQRHCECPAELSLRVNGDWLHPGARGWRDLTPDTRPDAVMVYAYSETTDDTLQSPHVRMPCRSAALNAAMRGLDRDYERAEASA